MVGQVRKDELLAGAVVTEGRKEWFYRFFCSETNVWTSAKCRRCKTDILVGFPSILQGVVFEECAQLVGGVCFVRWRIRC